MNIPLPLRLPLIALGCVLVVGRESRLKAAEVSPLDLVADSAALCLEVTSVEATWKQMEQSRLASRVKTFPPFERFVRGPGFQQWLLVERYATQATGLPLSEHLLGLCSESLVVAVHLPDAARPQGVAIARARDAATLRRALEAWDKLEPNHVDKPRQHRGQAYMQRLKSSGLKEALYYTVFDRTLVFSDQEGLVRQAIELHEAALSRGDRRESAGTSPRSLGESDLYRRAQARLRKNAAAHLFVNARSWDKPLQDGAKNDPDAAGVLKVWRHVAALTASLRFDEGLGLEVVAELDRERLSSDWLRFVGSSQLASPWSERIPREALLAVCGHADVRPLIGWWLTVAPEAQSDDFTRGRRVLRTLLGGRDFLDDVLPAVLSDVTICVVSGRDATANQPPADVTAMLSWLPQPAGADTPELAASLDNALQFGMNFLAGQLAHDRPESRVVVAAETSSTSTLRWLKGLSLWEPAYRVGSHRLTLSSSRSRLISEEPSPSQNDSTPHSQRLAKHEQRFFPGATQLVWLDSAQARDALARHSDWIATMLSQQSPESKPKVAARLVRVGEVLQLFDAAFLAGTVAEDHVRVILGGALD